MVETPARMLLFGPPELLLGDRVVSLPTRKLLSLLAYLALEGPTPRVRLAELLWDATDERARANLRGELYRLKKTAFGAVLEQRTEWLGLYGVSSDVEDFERALAKGDWRGAHALRRGPLLEGFSLPESLEFEAWLGLARERLEERFNEVLAERAEQLERDTDADGALETHRSLLVRDPLREDSHRAVMRLLERRAEPAKALEHYRRYATFLFREMGLEPSTVMRDLAHALGHGTRGNAVASSDATTPPSLKAPPLVGREAVWAELERRPRGLVLLVAEAGAGKTRLATEFARTRPSMLILPHREMAAQVGFGGVIEGLRTRLEAGWRPVMLEPVWHSEASRLLPELKGDSPEPAQDANPARFREAVARALLSALEPGGVIVLDDLHWADETTLQFLPYLVRRAASASVRVIGTTRPEGLQEGGWLDRAERELAREGLAFRFNPAPLSEPDVLALVRDLSGVEGGRVFSHRLHHATNGNPFYVLETLRALFERGELRADDQGWHTPFDQDTKDYRELHLPESVLESVRERFNRLEDAPRRAAELLALSNRDLSADTLVRALRFGEDTIVDSLETLEHTGLVTGGPNGHRLSHDLSRTALTDGLSSARRTMLHARLTEVFLTLPNEPGLSAEIAHHAEAAGNWAVACDRSERAATEARSRYAHRETADLLDRALLAQSRLGFDPEREFQLRLGREDALQWLGEHEARARELEYLEAILVGSQITNPTWRDQITFRRGRLAEARGLLEEAAQHFERCPLPEAKLALIRLLGYFARGETARATALELFREAAPEYAVQAAITLAVMDQERGAHADAESWLDRVEPLAARDPRVRLEVLRVRARQANLTGRFEETIPLAIRAETLARELGVTEVEAVCVNSQGLSFLMRGRYAEAAAAFERVAEYGERIERPQHRVSSAINLSWVCLVTAEFTRGLEWAVLARDLAERIGDRGGAIESLLGWGMIEVFKNQPNAARNRFEAVLDLLDPHSPPHYRADANSGLGLCALSLGKIPEAIVRFREATSIKRAHPRMTPWMGDQAQLGLCLWLEGEGVTALQLLEEASASFLGSGLDFPQRVPWIHAQLLRQSGRIEAASVSLEQARVSLEQAAAAIPEAQRTRYHEAFIFNHDIRSACDGVWPDPPRLI